MKTIMSFFGILMACVALGGEAVSIKSVEAQQRYPWNGLVDIAVTVEGSEDDIAELQWSFVATNNATGAAVPVASVFQNGSDTGSGTTWTRRFIWNATNDVGEVKIDDLVLTACAKVLGGVQLWENGPYWAECNVGATQPEEYGYFFWWGDTVGYTHDGTKWTAVDGSETAFKFNYSNEKIVTYGKSVTWLKDNGYIDDNGNLTATHDAATKHWRLPWRMPTELEQAALVRNCTTIWTVRNGVSGCLVTGKGTYESRSIFFPVTGNGYGSNLGGRYGYHWSSTPKSEDVELTWLLCFGSSDIDLYSFCRYNGFSVRPVRGIAEPTVVNADATMHLKLDCRTGVRERSTGGEILRYDASWYENGEEVRITDNGDVIVSGTSGYCEWKPDSSCSTPHILQLEVLSNEQVIATESAQFSSSPMSDGGPYTETVDGVTWTYSVVGGEAELCGVTPSLDTLTIPASLGGRPVVRIGSIFANNSGLKSIEIPGSVSYIECAAFYECSELRSVTLHEGVRGIEINAFCFCYKLETINLPASLRSIGEWAFRRCRKLKNVTWPSGLQEIGECAFAGCWELTIVSLPASMTDFGYVRDGGYGHGPFADCKSLTSINVDSDNPAYKSVDGLLLTKDGKKLLAGINGRIVIPAGVTSIAKSAFYGRSGLISAVVPDGVTSIGEEAFYNCSGMENVKIPSSAADVGKNAFYGCNGITSAVLPEMRYDMDLSSITNLIISDGTTVVGYQAFIRCSGITRVTIPSSVSVIGNEAFYGCSGLKSVIISEGVTTVGSSAFSQCADLTSVTIPSSVTSVGDNAFAFCGLQDIVFRGNAPETGSYAFGTGGTATVRWGTTGWDDDGDGKWQYHAWQSWPNSGWHWLSLKYVDKPIVFTASGFDGKFDGVGHGLTISVDDPQVGAIVSYSLTQDGEYGTDQILFTNAMEQSQCVFYKIESENYTTTNGVASVWIHPRNLIDGVKGCVSSLATGGASSWCWDFGVGEPSLVSGRFLDQGESWMELVVTNDAKVMFDCKASTLRLNNKAINTFQCLTNGVEVLSLDGNVDWQSVVLEVTSGTVLRWGYSQIATYGTDYENCGWVRNLAVYPKVTVGFYSDAEVVGELPDAFVLYEDESLTLPGDADFARMCYSFGGWSDGSRTYAPGEMYAGTNGSVNLYAVWRPNTLASPVIDVQAVYEAESQQISLASTNEGAVLYYSVGDASYRKYIEPFTVTGESVIRAYAMKDNYFNSPTSEVSVARQLYGVVFSAGEFGSIVSGDANQLIRYGDGVSTVAVEADKWHTFIGWSGATNRIVSATNFVAQYAPKAFTLKFGDADFDWTYGDALTGPTPTLAKHRLVGWIYQGTNYVVGSVLPFDGEDMSYTAVWEEKHLSAPVITLPEYYDGESCTATVTAQDGVLIRCKIGDGDWFDYTEPFAVVGSTTVMAYAAQDDWYDSDCVTKATVRGPWTFGEYLGASNVVFTSSDADAWRRTNEVNGVAGYYLACGPLDANETGSLSATFHGKGTIIFRFRASVESWTGVMDFDRFRFYDNGVALQSWSGETGWQEVSIELTNGLEHIVSWSYEKDGGNTFEANFDNCVWLDWVEWKFDPIPDLGENPTTEEITNVFVEAKAEDPKLAEKITTETAYTNFSAWAKKVQPHGGGDAVGAAGVMAAPNAWLSYALGSETLLEAALTDADLTVETFGPKSGEDGKFDFTVSVKDVEVGGAAQTEAQKEQVKENLKQVFGLEGGTSLEKGGMSSANVEIEFDTPQDGKVKFTAGPKDTGAKTFFIKVKVK